MKYSTEPETAPRTYRTIQVSELAQVSLRQLQWWDETRVVMPEQFARRRIYTFDQVLQIMVIAEFRRKGYSLQRVQTLLRRFPQWFSRASKKYGPESIRRLHVVADGRSVSLEREEDDIIDILKRATAGTAIVSVGDQVRVIEEYSGGINQRAPGVRA